MEGNLPRPGIPPGSLALAGAENLEMKLPLQADGLTFLF